MSDQQTEYWQRRLPRTVIPVPEPEPQLIEYVEPVETVEPKHIPEPAMTRGEMAIKLTAMHFKQASRDITGRSRKKDICTARHVAIFVWLEVVKGGYGLGYSKAARRFGRDHTSIMYAKEKILNTPELQATAHMLIDEININKKERPVMRKAFDCPKCGKCFTTKHGTAMHIEQVHGTIAAEPRKRPKHPRYERDPSLADISVDAYLKRAMGEPLDPLEKSLIND